MAASPTHKHTYEIVLRKPSPGNMVINAVKGAIKKAGGDIEQKIHDYYAPAGTHHVAPMTVTLHGRIGALFGRKFISERIDLRLEDHKKITIYCDRSLSAPKFHFFAAAINESLR